MNNKPQEPTEYLEWLKERHEVDITSSTKDHYDYIADTFKRQFEASHFWKQLGANLTQYNDEYYVSHSGYELLAPKTLPDLDTKDFDSFLLKTQRINILENDKWDKPPEGGWLLPDNWYTSINDIVRTSIVVKYLDGIEFMRDKIKTLCDEENERYFKCKFKSGDEGYYAAHIYMQETCEVPRYLAPGTEELQIFIEIQLTTQLKEAIYDLLHKHYEKRRALLIPIPKEVWQWDYQSTEFATNYLGHILHYLDGMMVNIKEKE